MVQPRLISIVIRQSEFSAMHRLLPFFLVLLGLFSGFHQIIGTGSFAHFNLKSLCQDGVGLANQDTDSSSVELFQNRCDQFNKKFKEESRATFFASLYGGLASLLLVVVGINFRVISKWYAKFI